MGNKAFGLEQEVYHSRDISQVIEENDFQVGGVAEDTRESFQMLIVKSDFYLLLLNVLFQNKGNGEDLALKISKDLHLPMIWKTCGFHNGKFDVPIPVSNEYFIRPLFIENKTFIKVILYITREKQIKEIATTNNTSIEIRDKGFLTLLNPDEIIFAQADGLYTKIITTKKSYMIRDILKNFEAKLSKKEFIRVHKSYLVNKNFIHSFNSKKLLIKNQYIPIRRGLFKFLKETLTCPSNKVPFL